MLEHLSIIVGSVNSKLKYVYSQKDSFRKLKVCRDTLCGIYIFVIWKLFQIKTLK